MTYIILALVFVAIITFIIQNPIIWFLAAVIVAIIIFAAIAYYNSKKTTESKSENEETKDSETTSNTGSESDDCYRKRLGAFIPEFVSGKPLVYRYNKLSFIPSDSAKAEIEKMSPDNDLELNASVSENGIALYHNDILIGYTEERKEMISDWLRRGDPLKIWLENLGDNGNYFNIAFYRDEQKRLAFRENSVVKLTRYANSDAQDNMIGILVGVKLDFDDDYDDYDFDYYNDDIPEGTVFITYCGDAIGTLPKRVAEKYLNEGAAGVFLDHMDYDDKGNDVPYVKIYW